MIIRKARLSEVPGVGRLWVEFRKDHDSIVTAGNRNFESYIIYKKGAEKMFEKLVRKTIHSKNGSVMVAEEDGKLVGYTLFFAKKGTPIFRNEVFGYISDLFVKKDFRGRGISSLFKEEATRFFRKKGIKHMSLMVFATNGNAHGVYSRWGFQDYHIEMRKEI